MKQYYFSNGQDPIGPFSLEELSKQAITPNSLIWHEGITDWQPANKIEELWALMTPTLPPIRRVSPPPISNHQSVQDKKTPFNNLSSSLETSNILDDQSKRKYYLIGGSIILLLLLLFSGVLGNLFHGTPTSKSLDNTINSTGVANTIETTPTSIRDSNNINYANSNENNKLIQADREQKRAWNRKHFLEYVGVSVKSYSSSPFGGISNGIFTLRNQSGYRLQNIVVMMNYYKPNGQVINTESVEIEIVAAHETREVFFPSSSRGIRADCYLVSLDAPGLNYHYNFYEQESDVGRTSYN